MKTIIFVLLPLLSVMALGFEFEVAVVKEKSEIRIVSVAHEGIVVFLKKIDNNEKALSRIEYIVKCKKGVVKAKELYFTNNGDVIEKEKKADLRKYICLWKDLYDIGLKDLSALPLDDAIDPFEFIDSWRIDKNYHDLYFETTNEKISFSLYDIDSYRDKRFLAILKIVLAFFGEEVVYK